MLKIILTVSKFPSIFPQEKNSQNPKYEGKKTGFIPEFILNYYKAEKIWILDCDEVVRWYKPPNFGGISTNRKICQSGEESNPPPLFPSKPVTETMRIWLDRIFPLFSAVIGEFGYGLMTNSRPGGWKLFILNVYW